MTGRIVLLGATGYTGGLVVDALRDRGLKPVLAGRDRIALQERAEAAGGLDYALADVTDTASIRQLVDRGDVLVTTVGPFERFGYQVARAAAEVGAHYVDSTGEVGFVLNLQQQFDDRARQTGSVMLPAFGYDYVPGILAGTMAGLAAGTALRSIDIGYFATGPLWRGLSQGTRATMRDGLTLPAACWRNNQLINERTASTVRRFSVRGRRKSGFLVSGTEVLFLPSTFPTLDSVTVYNGWFPALSRPTAVLSAAAAAATGTALGRKVTQVLTRPVIGPAGGPDAVERDRTRTHVVAVASSGRESVGEVHLEGPSIYSLTAELMAWAADMLATESFDAAGVLGPVEAFGFHGLRRGCAEIGLIPV